MAFQQSFAFGGERFPVLDQDSGWAVNFMR